MKLVALGDSVMKGVILNKEGVNNRYSLADKSILEHCADSLGAECLNLGKMGCTIEESERILAKRLDRMRDAKYVLLECGGNDSDYDWSAIAQNPEAEHFPKTSLDCYIAAYKRVIQKIKEIGAKPLVLSLPPMDAERYFAFFSSGWTDELRENVLRWLGGTTSTILSGHELYNLATMQVAQKTGVQWIDVTTELLRDRNYRHMLCEDGIHPNEQGLRRMAEVVLGVLR